MAARHLLILGDPESERRFDQWKSKQETVL